MFKLKELLHYKNIVIQCHNFPDADALASGFAVYAYLKENNVAARFIYSGPAKITKPNLLLMVDILGIDVEYVKEPSSFETLVMVDCQYNQSNVTKHEANKIFELDHHEDNHNGHDGIIQSSLGSCSTLIWNLLRNEAFDLNAHEKMACALYYGLYTDTNSFEEIAHPLDKDMRDDIHVDKNIIDLLRFNNLTMDELKIAADALAASQLNSHYNFAIFKAAPCDQNILGFISDLALQVEKVDVCVVYNTLPGGYKLSVRSCVREVMANEFAAYLANGGGHRQKAGGFIPKDAIGEGDVSAFIENRITQYFESYDLVYATNHNLDVNTMHQYEKLPVPVAYVQSVDIFEAGTPMLIRTLEGDSDVIASDDIYLMIGIEGEVYPIKREKFETSYTVANTLSFDDSSFSYSPTVKNKITGESVPLKAYATSCIPTGKVNIYAKKLEKNTKVFTAWNPNSYMTGKTGDYIAMRMDSNEDVYIVQEHIFYKTYCTQSVE